MCPLQGRIYVTSIYIGRCPMLIYIDLSGHYLHCIYNSVSADLQSVKTSSFKNGTFLYSLNVANYIKW